MTLSKVSTTIMRTPEEPYWRRTKLIELNLLEKEKLLDKTSKINMMA